MKMSTCRIVAALLGLTIVAGLAGCNSQPPVMNETDFANNRETKKLAQATAAARR